MLCSARQIRVLNYASKIKQSRLSALRDPKMSPEKPLFFENQARFREWLQIHHAKKPELWVGYYKKHTGMASITWPESVDEGLCFGWIDGLRKSIDDEGYKIRFTPRNSDSHWSHVNIERIEKLQQLGLVSPAGLAAYSKRTEKNTGKAPSSQLLTLG